MNDVSNPFAESQIVDIGRNIRFQHTYIVYTTEGYTQTPKGRDVENCQILAILETESTDRDEIIAMLKSCGEHIKDYSKDKIFIRECFDDVL